MIDFEDKNNDILKGYSMLLSFSGSFILNKPQQSCINDLALSNIFKNMPVRSSNPSFVLASSYLNVINSNSNPDFEKINDDYKDLFDLTIHSKAPPLESQYLSASDILLNGQVPHPKKVYETYGWRSPYNGSIPEDHIGIEIQFLILLLEKLHEQDDNICRVELTKDLRKFISERMIKWVPVWNHDLQKHSNTNFYKGIGYLVVSCLQDILEII